ncbi:MAG: valine--tRNA ligase [Dehalococcoidales bacterium]|nr:valine--tRNA ligase [Dehalococcoidales bacterium]
MAEEANTRDEMPKAYEPGKTEQKWYRFWLDKGYFTPRIDPDKKPFVIIMPLPNVTGGLHVGHALTDTMEDIMTRWHRMMGEPTLWLPGLDHAGIATQVVVERKLAAEGLDRHRLGREKFRERVWQWAEECRQTITRQHQRLGASCDWSREQFTLDEKPSRAVRTAFVRLYEKGLIYRGERIINWCPRCATALSDLETDHKELTGHLYYVRYPVAGSDDFITVATTRPETILGDTAVAVNPGDERFKDMVGKKVILPAVNREIPIIADEAVDPAFGTGAVKITPAHDPVDFEVAQRQGLPLINILNPDATMNENAGPYAGLDRFACREKILADLEKDGLLVRIEPYGHSVGHCLRCQTVIEPIASKQWFINTRPLAQPAIDAVADGRINIVPARFTRVYFNWMENIRDWCISRQLWWGHRIPVWYCADCDEITVAVDEPKVCGHCGSAKIEQDPDVLDTWFSSALWTHSTLGWPDDTEEMRYFYPTSVMETGYDILFFWVARMIMMGLEDTGDIPFRTVYLHGLIRDERGEKMSKVRGNVLDPIDTLEQYGTDALRFALSTGTAPGNDSKLTQTRLEAGRNFANKLWNATRFVVRSIETGQVGRKIGWDALRTEDHWILSRLSRTVSGVTALMEDFQFGEAQRQLYDFLWSEFCDWYIELAKVRLRSGGDGAPSPVTVLVYVLETSLRLLHPYMPFVTEELWQHLRRHLSAEWQAAESIMIAPYPEADSNALNPEAEEVMETVIEIVRSIRNARVQNKVESGRWIEAQIYGGTLTSAIAPYSEAIETLARARPVNFLDSRREGHVAENTVVMVLKEVEVVIPLASMIDLDAEKQRLEKEIEGSREEVARLEARLNDPLFRSRAPEAVVNKERDKLAVVRDKVERLQQQLAGLG